MSTKPPEKLARALSIRQPYVELIFQGKKRKELRSRVTHIRERVYLYAALQLGDVAYGEGLGIPAGKAPSLPRGGVLGSVEVVGCVWDKTQQCYAWLLENPKRFRGLLRVVNQPQPGFWFPELETS